MGFDRSPSSGPQSRQHERLGADWRQATAAEEMRLDGRKSAGSAFRCGPPFCRARVVITEPVQERDPGLETAADLADFRQFLSTRRS